MDFAASLLLALALAMDAFAVSIVRGMTGRGTALDAVCTSLCFAGAQALMPVLGYLIGQGVAGPLVHRGGALLAGGILLLLGARMIHEGWTAARAPAAYVTKQGGYFRLLAAQSLATAIDAMAVGVGLCAVKGELLGVVTTIGWVTGVLCFLGYQLGRCLFDNALGAKAQILGGVVLGGIGVRMLIGSFG